jgi:hypothetical protein
MKKNISKKIISLSKEFFLLLREYKNGDPVFIIENEADLQAFISKLGEDSFEFKKKSFLKEAKKWLKSSTDEKLNVLVVWDFPDDHGRNDGWGSQHVFFFCLVNSTTRKKMLAFLKKENF